MANNEEVYIQHNWEKLHVPSRVDIDKQSLTDFYGKFTIQPLYKGYGVTIGHALRRSLISSLQGSAVYAVKIEGVSHEFEALQGIKEDVLQVILNLKELKLKHILEGDHVLELKAKGKKILRAKDIKTEGKVQAMDPKQIICELDNDASVDIKLYVKMNNGFVSAEENYNEDLPIGTIFLDSKHSPVEKVNYEIQNARLGQKNDYDKLVFELWTNGGIRPDDAIAYSAKILKEFFDTFINFDETSIKPIAEEIVEEKTEVNPNLYRSVNELELSVRSINCLQNAKIDSIGELVQKTEAEMLKTKNFGRKSLSEIKTILASMGLSLGMQIDNYSPENNLTEIIQN